MIDPALLPALVAREPVDVLARAVKVSRERRAANRTPPRLTLLLASGREVTGEVIDVASSSSRTTVSLVVEPRGPLASDRRKPDVLYVDAQRIEGVVLHDAEDVAAALAPEAMLPAVEPTGKLQLRRRLGELGAELGNVVGRAPSLEVDVDAIAGVPHGLAALAQLVDQTATALRQITTDDTGRRAVRDQVSAVRFEVGPPRGVRRDGTILKLAVPAPDAGAGFATAAALMQEIERVL